MEEKHIALSLELDEINFIGQAEYTEKIWENLLSNALKYTPDNGMIEVSLTEVENNIIITFSDSGVGIAKEHIPLLFDRFYRVDEARHDKIEGTGLGLSIVHQAVALHQGSIEVMSELEEGTIFTIRLPIND